MDKTATQANPLLAQMNDIALPAEVSSWPPAPWVWSLALVLLVALALGLWLIIKARAARRQRIKPRDEALALLSTLEPGSTSFALDLSALLKRVALSYAPRNQVASLTGAAWVGYLNSHIPGNMPATVQGNTARDFEALADAAYRPAPLSQEEAEALKNLAKFWLEQYPMQQIRGAGTNQPSAAISNKLREA